MSDHQQRFVSEEFIDNGNKVFRVVDTKTNTTHVSYIPTGWHKSKLEAEAKERASASAKALNYGYNVGRDEALKELENELYVYELRVRAAISCATDAKAPPAAIAMVREALTMPEDKLRASFDEFHNYRPGYNDSPEGKNEYVTIKNEPLNARLRELAELKSRVSDAMGVNPNQPGAAFLMRGALGRKTVDPSDVPVLVPPSEWQVRLNEELKEVSDRLSKLSDFILSDKYDDLPDIDRKNLKEQHHHMKAYVEVLRRRVSRIDPKR